SGWNRPATAARRQRCSPRGQDDVGRKRRKFRRISHIDTICFGSGPAVIDIHIAALNPTQGLQPLVRALGTGVISSRIHGHPDTVPPAMRAPRPAIARAAAHTRDEVPPPHGCPQSSAVLPYLRNHLVGTG